MASSRPTHYWLDARRAWRIVTILDGAGWVTRIPIMLLNDFAFADVRKSAAAIDLLGETIHRQAPSPENH